MSEIVNLRLARKAKARVAHAAAGDAARAKSGRTRLDRDAAARDADPAKRHLDGHLLRATGEAGDGEAS